MTIDPSVLERFRGLAAATVYEGAGKLGDMSPDIRPLFDEARIVARAYTVKCFPGDIAAMMRSVDEAEPGDVLVIDGGGTNRVITWGGSGTVAAKHRGLAGVVTNGAVRDVEQIRRLKFPVFAAGIAVRGGLRNHPGWTGIDICVGGATVRRGDLIVADIDGVVVVPQERATSVLEKSLARQKHEQEAERRLSEGVPYSVWTGTARTE